MKGLCLSGGGVKAAAHIGALKAFEEENIKFDCVSGASSGSMIATMYALGYTSDEILKMFKKYSPKIKYFEWKNIFNLLMGIIFKGQIVIDGLNSGKIIKNIIKEICMEKNINNIKDIQMPLLISMVGLQNGKVYIASSKKFKKKISDKIEYIFDISISTAVQASSSFPVVMEPCVFNDIQLIDGGVRENIPWKCLREIGADEILGINFSGNSEDEIYCKNIIDIAERSFELQSLELLNYEKDGIDKMISIPLKKVSLLDFSRIDELYKIGYEFTKKQLKSQTFSKLDIKYN